LCQWYLGTGIYRKKNLGLENLLFRVDIYMQICHLILIIAME
jgi:hypothetical protein